MNMITRFPHCTATLCFNNHHGQAKEKQQRTTVAEEWRCTCLTKVLDMQVLSIAELSSVCNTGGQHTTTPPKHKKMNQNCMYNKTDRAECPHYRGLNIEILDIIRSAQSMNTSSNYTSYKRFVTTTYSWVKYMEQHLGEDKQSC